MAGDVAFSGNPLANRQACDTGAQVSDFAHILMANGHGRTDVLYSPGVPVINMDICAADGGFVNLDQDFAGTWLRNRNFPQFQTGAGIGLTMASMYCCILLLLRFISE